MARRRVLITTPYPSLNRVAKLLGVPRREVEAVKAMVDEILADRGHRHAVKQRRPRRRNHGKPS
jgi:predicted HAD superfamily phosphohydrolase